MTGFPLEASKTVIFSFSIIISLGVKYLFHRSCKRFTSDNPAAYGSANFDRGVHLNEI